LPKRLLCARDVDRPVFFTFGGSRDVICWERVVVLELVDDPRRKEGK